jgi:hypothetical protein
MGEIEIWLHRAGRIINKPECRFRRAWLRYCSAHHLRGPVHCAGAEGIQIAHCNEGGMAVRKIVAEAERDGR